MPAPRRTFTNVDVQLAGMKIRAGVHEARGTKTLKLEIEGEWSVEQLFRGAKSATRSVLVLKSEELTKGP